MREWGRWVIVPLALLFLVSLVSAQESELALSWFTVDGGGGISSDAARYSLVGTVGQPDAHAMVGVGYALSGGFHAVDGGVIALAHAVYLPLILR